MATCAYYSQVQSSRFGAPTRTRTAASNQVGSYARRFAAGAFAWPGGYPLYFVTNMTRKHFEKLAAAIRANKPDAESNSLEAETPLWENIGRDIADVCATENSNFNRARFLKACGMEA